LAAFLGGLKMDFLAKSNGETLSEHTENLLIQFKLLKKFYPQALVEDEWNILLLACKYHDLGKMNNKFQDKIKNKRRGMEKDELPHGLLSASLIPYRELQALYPISDLRALAYSVALHHERDFSEFDQDDYKREVRLLAEPADNFDFNRIGLHQMLPQVPSGRYFEFKTVIGATKEPDTYSKYVKTKGLLNRIDFAASGYYQVEFPDNGYLQANLQKNALGKWQKKHPDADWNEMQTWMGKHIEDNVMIIAQTGMGKTEGGLRWLANDKGFFTLPLKSAINSIYDRIKNEIFEKNEESKKHVGILHSDMQQILLEEFEKNDDFNSSNLNDYKVYLNETRGWSLPLTITTLDQVFNVVYHYRGYEPKLATLSYSKIIIDEIQMYSPDLLAYLIYGLKMIQKLGGKFAVMTATLAPFVVDLFKKNGLEFIMPTHPFLLPEFSQRHSVKILHHQLNANDIKNSFHNNKVLVICNTIKEAVSLYDELSFQLKDNVKLIHSRFIRKDRQRLEKEITNFSSKENKKFGVWIGTQVVEASLDIDFDVLYTELSELNSLFQRMGRCYRRRNFDRTGYNVFIYDGGEELPSGVHESSQRSVYDYEMFSLSKKIIANLNGPLSEQDKMDLIERTYTMKNLKDSSYLIKVRDTFEYLDACSNDHKSKQEIAKEFRDIESVTGIPQKIADENEALIKRLNELLQSNNYQKNQYEITKLKNKVLNLTVQVPSYLFYQKRNDIEVGFVELSRYQKIPIISDEYEYDNNKGLSLSPKKKRT
jgi:CRISPR-associated endonuclease/helicase Cas3